MNRGRERENQFTQFDQRPETVAASSTREMLPITNNAVCMTIHAHAHSNNNVTLVSMNNDTRLCEPNRSMAPLLCNASKRRSTTTPFLFLSFFPVCAANLQPPPAQCPISSQVAPLNRMDLLAFGSLISIALWITLALQNRC